MNLQKKAETNNMLKSENLTQSFDVNYPSHTPEMRGKASHLNVKVMANNVKYQNMLVINQKPIHAENLNQNTDQ